ncbi:MAG: YifB family Mg chelatase-like AAA ATPase [Bacteroidales bacterium]|nr:YifB family Mg chelatase-like AAA ATPase [Bacteroidales bacterium]
MLIRIIGAKCVGVEAVKVTVEVNIDRGIGIHLVGLADVAVKESLLRTTTALQSLGYHIPGKRIVINLAPADLHKNGSGYDLPIAIGIIAASGQVDLPLCERYMLMGELGLDGSVRDIPGALPFAELSAQEGLEGIVLPEASALEAAELHQNRIYGVKTLDDVVRILSGGESDDLLIWNSQSYRGLTSGEGSQGGGSLHGIPDFADIIGQEGAKRGMEIAAAGAHNLAMIGPPGSGKSSLAKALAGILPPMTREESLMTSKIFSIAGKGNLRFGLMNSRPFRAPHYSASLAAIIGGGAGDNIIPGEVSLAHNGVLFCDEAAQMPRSVIEALRGPIEDRKVVISRLKAKVEYPSSFMLVLASNPCPCGYWGVGDRCTCTPTQRLNYLARLSGPIMDRIDIQLLVPCLSALELSRLKALEQRPAESSAVVAARVASAREIQQRRLKGTGIFTNAEMDNKLIERFCPLSDECSQLLISIMEKLGLSMRAYFRIIKVARTIADLALCRDIMPEHISEAAAYRFLDRQNGPGW